MSRLEKIKKMKEKLKLKKDKEDNKDPEREEDDDLIDIATNMEGTWMNWRKTEPEEDEIVPTEDGEVEAEIESVEIQGAVREEPVDWKEDGEDMELVEQLGDLDEDEVPDLGQDDQGGQSLCLDCVHRPCICILVKAELKVKIFKENNKTERLKLDDS